MAVIQLSWRARKTLKRVAQSGSKGREVRRAQALLWLDQGENVTTVARRLGLSRRAIYKIVQRYQARRRESVEQRVSDRPHLGRPARKRTQAMDMVGELLSHPPGQYGYRELVWTTPMLRCQIQRRFQQPVSQRTVRRALRALRQRYKRPRYVLARRSPTWRQAKGGSNAAFPGVAVP
jgi:transposase